MEGQEYVAINPDTLSDKAHWTYADLRKLCCKLSLGGKGSREELEQKLRDWHRARNNWTGTVSCQSELFPMNVPGNNFSLLQINVRESKKKTTKRRRSSVVGLEEDKSAVVDPLLLRPFRKEANVPVTPSKGILKKPTTLRAVDTENTPPTKLARLQFSPFNGVKIISHRQSLYSPFGFYDD
mmetsp:Transcript_26718/g.39688  ORF Transcript_26718/g.39688 Transcript_26718/m.39688 type:complete len:182 (-) Transcript_26718:96-641(-)